MFRIWVEIVASLSRCTSQQQCCTSTSWQIVHNFHPSHKPWGMMFQYRGCQGIAAVAPRCPRGRQLVMQSDEGWVMESDENEMLFFIRQIGPCLHEHEIVELQPLGHLTPTYIQFETLDFTDGTILWPICPWPTPKLRTMYVFFFKTQFKLSWRIRVVHFHHCTSYSFCPTISACTQ